jgi:hypothetical protein
MFRAGKAASRFRLLQSRINHPNKSAQQIRFNSTESVDVASKYSSVESLFKEEGIMLEDEAVQTAFEASTKFGDYGLGLHSMLDVILPQSYFQAIPDFFLNVCNLDAALAIFVSQLVIRGIFVRFWLTKEIEMAAAIQNQNADVLSKMDVGKSNGLMEMSNGSSAYTAKMEKISEMSEIHNDIGPRLVDSSGLVKASQMDNLYKTAKKSQGDRVLGQINIYQVSKYENLGYYQADWLRKFDTMKWTMHSSMREVIPIDIKNDKAPHKSIWDHSFIANMLKPMSLMLPMMTCWRAMVNKEYPLQTNFNWNDIANYGIVTEKLDLLEKDQSGLLLYTWMTIQTSSFIWQFHRDPREKFRKGVWIVAPLGVYAFGSFLLEDRASALLVALTANAIATAGIKSYARSDDFRKTYGLNTYKQDIEIIKDMQTKQKEAKRLYTGIPENLIPEEYKRYVPKAKQGSAFMDNLQSTIESIAPMQGGTTSSGKDSNKLLYRRHALANSNSQMSNFQAKEFDEFQKIKNKTFSPTKWWRYSCREKHDRKILGFIPQKGYSTLESDYMREMKSSYAEGDSLDSKEEKVEQELVEAQQPEVEEMPTYFKINLDQIYKDGAEGEKSDWAEKDKAGMMAPLVAQKFGKIGKLSPLRHVQ